MSVLWTEFPVLKRFLHFAASLLQALKTCKKSARIEITKVSSVSSNIAAKLLQATFPLKWLNMLDTFLEIVTMHPELVAQRRHPQRADIQWEQECGDGRRLGKLAFILGAGLTLAPWSFWFDSCWGGGCAGTETKTEPTQGGHLLRDPAESWDTKKWCSLERSTKPPSSHMETARKKAASSMTLGGKENNSIPNIHSQQLSLPNFLSKFTLLVTICPVGFPGTQHLRNPPAMLEMQETQ